MPWYRAVFTRIDLPRWLLFVTDRNGKRLCTSLVIGDLLDSVRFVSAVHS